MSASDYYITLPSELFPLTAREEIWEQVRNNDWVKRERVIEPNPDTYVQRHQGNLTWWKTELDNTQDKYREIFASNLSDILKEHIGYETVLLSLQKIQSRNGHAFGVHYDRDICSIQMVLSGDRTTPVSFWEDDPRESDRFAQWGTFPDPDQQVVYNDDIVYLNTIKWHNNNGLVDNRYLLRFILNLNQKSHLTFDYFRKKLNEIL